MHRLIQELILFLLAFLLVFILYQIFIIRKAKPSKKKRRGRKEKKIKEPVEVTYLVNKYNLDLDKVDYNKLLFVISVVSSLDIALVVSIIMILNNFILGVIIGFISILGIILLSYHLVYLVYKKKGMIKDDTKRDRK